MSKKEVLTQLCKGVIEKDGCTSQVSCDEIECMDCPLSEFNRIDIDG